MKKSILILFFLSLLFSAFSQKTSFKHNRFIYKSQKYEISEFKELLQWDESNLALLNKIHSIDKNMKVWKAFTIGGAIGSGVAIGGIYYFGNLNASYPLIPVLGIIGSTIITIVGVTITVISGTGWLITGCKRNKRIDSFLTEFNSGMTSNSKELNLSLGVTQSGFGIVLSF